MAKALIDDKMMEFDKKVKQMSLLFADFILQKVDLGSSGTGLKIPDIIDKPRKSAEQTLDSLGIHLRKMLKAF